MGEEEKKSGRRRRIERKSDPRAWCVTRDGRDHFSCEESELRTSPAVLHPPWEEGGGGRRRRRGEEGGGLLSYCVRLVPLILPFISI